jgi:hypothetical protein
MPFMNRGLQVRVNSDFKARVPGDRPVTLRVRHALLVPAADAGSATVTAPGASVVLKLVRGAEARFRVEGQADPREARGLPGESRILLFAGKPEGEPVFTCPVTNAEGSSRIGGYRPGKYTLWCDLGRTAAPLVMEDVTLIDGVTDLGDLKLPEGAAVRVKIVTREGQQAPRVDVSATPIEKPTYRRSGGSRGTAEVLLKGLGPGKFKVEVRAGDFRAAPAVYEIDSTGSGEIALTHEVK